MFLHADSHKHFHNHTHTVKHVCQLVIIESALKCSKYRDNEIGITVIETYYRYRIVDCDVSRCIPPDNVLILK